ncbi:HalOD1 output domain-containing protein [Halobacterium wangiae]|uniref:HalOD1 output domain-containing protein n=1 Tax=Halobacterium wangiae TaxID=2902623 RepID=UPI001E58AC30|nr:HalOD1 output domain-containing protein [Halobacterium wangiae]
MLQGDPQRTASQTFTWTDDESVSAAVVRSVASYTGRDPMSIAPLYTAIDPDALDALFDSRSEQRACIEFSFCGLRVQVSADGDGKLFEER